MRERAGVIDTGFWGTIDPTAGVHRFDALLGTIDDGIVQLGESGQIAGVNDAIADRTGHSRDAMVGHHVSFLFPAMEADRLARPIERQHSGGGNTVDLALHTAIGDLPHVRGDGSQLHHVFRNLLGNTVTYRGEEPPEIGIGAERRGDDVAITGRDDDIGIPPEQQDRIFEVFQRIEPAHAQDGTEIELPLCRRTVERHGGRIDVDSTPGEGTAITFTLEHIGETNE